MKILTLNTPKLVVFSIYNFITVFFIISCSTSNTKDPINWIGKDYHTLHFLEFETANSNKLQIQNQDFLEIKPLYSFIVFNEDNKIMWIEMYFEKGKFKDMFKSINLKYGKPDKIISNESFIETKLESESVQFTIKRYEGNTKIDDLETIKGVKWNATNCIIDLINLNPKEGDFFKLILSEKH